VAARRTAREATVMAAEAPLSVVAQRAALHRVIARIDLSLTRKQGNADELLDQRLDYQRALEELEIEAA
jgi:hypothetical protein